FALDRARFHHRRHAIGPSDVLFIEDLDHVDVDKIDAELLPGNTMTAHLLDDRISELGHLLGRSRASGTFDPGEGMPHVLLRQPRDVPLDLKTDIALLKQYRPPIAAQHSVAQSRLEPVPAGRQRASNVAAIFVVHAKQSAEPMLFHHLARPLDAIFAEPVPIDPLLPVHAGDAEIRSHRVLPLVVKVFVPTRASLPTEVGAQGDVSPLLAVLSPSGKAAASLSGSLRRQSRGAPSPRRLRLQPENSGARRRRRRNFQYPSLQYRSLQYRSLAL